MKQDDKNKQLSIITYDMSDKDRADYLKNKNLSVVINDETKFNDVVKKYQTLNVLKTNEQRKALRKFGEERNVFKEYKKVGDTKLSAYFSRNSLFESVSKSSDVPLMYYVIFNIDEVLKKSVKIEEHLENKLDENNKATHEFLSTVLIENDKIILIKTTLKESKYSNNNIYSISNLEIIKEDDGHPQMFELNQALETGHPLLFLNIAQLISNVNNESILRYIPNELLNSTQIQIKKEAIDKYNEIKKIQIERKQNKLKDK